MALSDSTDLDDQLVNAATNGDVDTLAALLDAHPDRLHMRSQPYEWTLLHHAARHLGAAELLLARGLDVNAREKGDNTFAMHWAAAAGQLDVVRRLADAGGDVIGHGDDHDLEVIGWATCWDECDTAAHRSVADFLVSRGARHHIFSAIAMDRADDVRTIVAGDPSAITRRMSRNENNQTPLHFAVRMGRPAMVALLIELGADPLAVDSGGMPAAGYATTPDVDRAAMEKIRDLARAELVSAERGRRPPRGGMLDVVALVSLGQWDEAASVVQANRRLVEQSGADAGSLHLLAKRGDSRGVQWLLNRGADVNARWPHWDADVTALHLAASRGHVDVVRVLLAAGADRGIRDSQHDSDPLGWAQFFNQPEVVRMLENRSP